MKALINGLPGAKKLIWRLINIRTRSEKEIRQRLKLKNFSSDLIEKSIEYFKNIELIDDKKFAREWIEARLNKPFGFRKITAELNEKGVSKKIIKQLLEEKRNAVNETEVIEELIQKQLSRLTKNNEKAQKIRSKIQGYLIRRGFDPEVVNNAVMRIPLK